MKHDEKIKRLEMKEFSIRTDVLYKVKAIDLEEAIRAMDTYMEQSKADHVKVDGCPIRPILWENKEA